MAHKLLLAACLSAAAAHICLLNPVQRGGFDVSGAGDNSCFQISGPCGDQPAELPSVKLVAGQAFDLLFQQNLNHYTVGQPGFIDIAWSTYPEPANDTAFNVLLTVPDFWAHRQATQTNFSIPLVVPDIECDHCVLRVRYHPTKPAVTFHQCADVMIVKSGLPPVVPSRVFAFAVPGTQSPSVRSLSLHLAELQRSGAVTQVDDYTLGLGYGVAVEGMTTSSAGVLYSVQSTYTGIAAGSAVHYLHSYNVEDGYEAVVNVTGLQADGTIGAPSQLLSISSAPFTETTGQVPVLAFTYLGNSTYQYEARLLDSASGNLGQALAVSSGTNTFINFFWSTDAIVDSEGNAVMYALGGDQDNLYQLDAQIYTIKFHPSAPAGEPPAAMTAVAQDNSRFTLSSMHLHPSGVVYAVSPGLFGSTEFSLVTVNPVTGAVNSVGVIAPAGTFDYWEGGSVAHAVEAATNTLLHVFRRSVDKTLVLARIDLTTGQIMDAPTLVTGVNGEWNFNTYVRVDSQ